MATARDIVERAFRKIGVVATDEAMSAEQGAVGIDALNMMMQAWVLDGIDVGHADLTLSEEFTLEPPFHEGCVYMLAERLAPDFSAQGFDAGAFKRRLSAAYLIIPHAVFDVALTRRRRSWL